MGRPWLFFWALILVVVGVQAAELRFEPAPVLLGTFRLVVEGVADEAGEVVLFSVATGQRLASVSLAREEGVLRSPPLQVVRACDAPAPGVQALAVTGAGELLVAASELACGLSAVAKVEPRTGPGALSLEVWTGKDWKPAETLGAGTYRVRVSYPPADRTCARDPLPGGLKVRVGLAEIAWELGEEEPTSGCFTWAFASDFRLDLTTPQILFRLHWDDKTLEVPAECAAAVVRAVDQELKVPVQSLLVEVKPDVALLVPVGCQAKVWLAQPENPEEVRWWVPGRGWFSGQVLELLMDELLAQAVPVFPEALLVKVFVRKGAAWGANQIAVGVVPRPKLTFVEAETRAEITEPWPIPKLFKIRLAQVFGVLVDRVVARVGKLGPHPREKDVELRRVEGGIYESQPLSPELWQAQAGEFLWAQVHLLQPLECVLSVVLPLR